MGYQDALKKHFGIYKTTNLGIEENGSWRNRPYPHILPPENYKLNILGTIKEQFWKYYDLLNTESNIPLHINFHHLNSSQAMCFNLFFPFISENYRYLPILIDALQLPKKEISEASFEKILDKKEGTNFDFYIKYQDGMQILFEVKLSENDFGSAKHDQRHIEKYNIIYKMWIKNIITEKYQKPSYFFKNYQVLRNLAYLGQSDKNTIFFIYPIENKNLDKKINELLPNILAGKFADRVIVGSLENLLEALISRFDDHEHKLLKKHFEWFVAKYVILSRSLGYRKSKYTYPLYKRFK
jgi:hypothetical protein